MNKKDSARWETFSRNNPGRISGDTGNGGLSKALKEQHGIDSKLQAMQLEHYEQTAIIDWSERPDILELFPDVAFLHAIPNGGKREKTEGKRMKDEGATRGIPDLCLPCKRGIYPGMYIEMKVLPNQPDKFQQRAIYYLRMQGFYVDVCYAGNEGIDLIVSYLSLSETGELGYIYQLPKSFM